jgi:hypothetical protein
MTGAMDRSTMKKPKEVNRRLPIYFSLLPDPSLNPSSRISAIGAFSTPPAWRRVRHHARHLFGSASRREAGPMPLFHRVEVEILAGAV